MLVLGEVICVYSSPMNEPSESTKSGPSQPAADASTPVQAEVIGHATATIPVEISTRFLEHFSEQLYSSPQKSFEELISNSWDAGADFVDIRIPPDLSANDATMAVLDNGVSMDEQGLRDLWHIAFSTVWRGSEAECRKVPGEIR